MVVLCTLKALSKPQRAIAASCWLNPREQETKTSGLKAPAAPLQRKRQSLDRPAGASPSTLCWGRHRR
jgi:hypothetical protein